MKNSPKTLFRGDIQGLRALAVGLVVFYHLWPNRLTGGFIGVDVFFVISGFLITAHLIKSPPRRLKDFTAFWLRRVKRLLPASFLVLGATLIGIWALAPETVWRDWGTQVLSATFYMQNWTLAASSVDYLAADNAVSAVQHFWSLSVEEQFYLFWPLIIGALVFVGTKFKTRKVSIPALGVAVLLTASLLYSIAFTATEPGIAYFSTFTRGWELAAGGMLAFLPKASEAFRRAPGSAVVSWLGLGGIVFAAFTYDGSTPFPSFTAALPVLGTAAVIWAHSESRLSPTGLLGLKPSRFLGDHSYSIYLWHWPLIVLLPFLVGPLRWPEKLGVIVLTVLLAMATKTLVEDRFRKSMDTSRIVTGGRFLLVGSLVLGLAGGSFLYGTVQREAADGDLTAAVERAVKSVGVECFGAAAMVNDCGSQVQDIMVPTPVVAKTDKSAAYADKCWSGGDFKDRPRCTYGDGPVQVALVGNSHAGHWLPALEVIAKDRGWTITTFLASVCSPTDDMMDFEAEAKAQGCHDYGKWVMDQTGKGKFDLVIASARQVLPVKGETLKSTLEPATAGYTSYLKKWAKSGTPVVVIRDNPFPGHTVPNIPDCIAGSNDPLKDCSGTPKSWKALDPLAEAAASFDSNKVHLVDMNEFFCTQETCPPIIGSVIPYFDASHITATYAKTLAPFLQDKIDRALSK